MHYNARDVVPKVNKNSRDKLDIEQNLLDIYVFGKKSIKKTCIKRIFNFLSDLEDFVSTIIRKYTGN